MEVELETRELGPDQGQGQGDEDSPPTKGKKKGKEGEGSGGSADAEDEFKPFYRLLFQLFLGCVFSELKKAYTQKQKERQDERDNRFVQDVKNEFKKRDQDIGADEDGEVLGGEHSADEAVHDVVHKVERDIKDQLKKGDEEIDLVIIGYRRKSGSGDVYYVKIRVGEGQVIHAKIFMNVVGTASLKKIIPDQTETSPINPF